MSPRFERLQPRVAWLLLLANTIFVFAYPAMFFYIAGEDYAGERLAVHDVWSWDWEVSLAPLAAVTLPRLGCFAYPGRLAIAAAFCFLGWFVLLQTSFREPFGCVHPAWVRTVPEHLTFASMLVLALLSHPPPQQPAEPRARWVKTFRDLVRG